MSQPVPDHRSPNSLRYRLEEESLVTSRVIRVDLWELISTF